MQPYNMFFRRVLHLSAQRVFELSELLGLNDSIKEQIWTVMKCLLSMETHLLVNRHLDQMIMCSIYGVSKIQSEELGITFNSIITKYSDLFAKAKQVQHVFISVLIDPAKGTKKDIINFYNDVYIKSMKTYIIALKPRPTDSTMDDSHGPAHLSVE